MSLLFPDNLHLKNSPTVAIVGAGISGLMSALFLHKAGARVTLFDKGITGMESSWAGSGIVSPMYPWNYANSVNELVFTTQKRIPELCKLLLAETNIDPQLIKSGFLMLDSKEICAAEAWAKKHEVTLDTIPHTEVNLLEPRLVISEGNYLWMPDIYQVRNPKLLQSLKSYLKLHAITINENCQIKSIYHGTSCGVVTDKGSKCFDKVVITTGAWTSKLLPEVQVYPVKGQIIVFNTIPGFLKHMVMQDSLYIIPRKDGKVLVGSSLEYVGYDKRTTNKTRKKLEKFAYSLYPELEMFDIEAQWAGLRPGKKDSIPYICKAPKYDNVFLNTGHFRNGVSMSIGSAIKLVEVMQGN